MQGPITILDIISSILILAGFILVALTFLHLGRKKNQNILIALFGVLLAFGIFSYSLKIISIIANTHILILGELPLELGIPPFDLEFFIFNIGIVTTGVLFGVNLILHLHESKVFNIITIVLAFSSATFAFMEVLFYFINPFIISLQYFMIVILSELIMFIFLIFVLIWFVKQKPSITNDEKVKDIQAPKPLEKDLALEDRLLKASKVYTRIPYKKLAKLLNCKTRELLDLVTELVSDDRLKATIEEPDIIFQH